MPTAETEDRKRGGRPRRYAPGRITSTVRHTPQLYAELEAAAAAAGRSISEQVEFELEELRRVGPKLDEIDRSLEAFKAKDEKLVEKYEAKIARLQGTIDSFKTTFEASVKLEAKVCETLDLILAQLQADRVATDERIARTVADAVAHAFERRK
jgi:hypothetical protein